jgi:RimJ/RimL family protein N-acetyltransferase
MNDALILCNQTYPTRDAQWVTKCVTAPGFQAAAMFDEGHLVGLLSVDEDERDYPTDVAAVVYALAEDYFIPRSHVRQCVTLIIDQWYRRQSYAKALVNLMVEDWRTIRPNGTVVNCLIKDDNRASQAVARHCKLAPTAVALAGRRLWCGVAT